MTRNPKWARDELILALDLYRRLHPLQCNQRHPDVIALSELLNDLPIHAIRPDAERFRNANGVYMKMCNFLRFDPEYKGEGLKAGGRLEEEVWKEFAEDTERLAAVAAAIRENAPTIARPARPPETAGDDGDDDTEAPEGRILTRVHRTRERNRALVERKKRQVLKATGHLACEACGFDFEIVYGPIGTAFCECHHLLPVSELKPDTATRLTDLAIVCANCHRMIHRRRPWVSLDEIASIVRGP